MATFRFNSKKSVDGPRQGNENDVVYIYTYVTEKTFDAYLFQLVETILEICKTKENSELEEKSTRLYRLNALLKLDEKENIIIEDDEKSEDDNLKSQDYDKEPIR